MAVALACSAIGALRAGYDAPGAGAPSPLRGGSFSRRIALNTLRGD